MDTAGIELPGDAAKTVRRGVAAGVVAAAAIGALAAGYALGTTSSSTSPSATIVTRGAPTTWADVVQEANALKRYAAETARAKPLDIRIARVER